MQNPWPAGSPPRTANAGAGRLTAASRGSMMDFRKILGEGEVCGTAGLSIFSGRGPGGNITTAAHSLRIAQPTLSRQIRNLEEQRAANELAAWFGLLWNQLNIVTPLSLCYSAAVMAKQGVDYMISLDKLADISAESPLCSRPLEPRLESNPDLVWKRYQVFSQAAELFSNRLRERFAREQNGGAQPR